MEFSAFAWQDGSTGQSVTVFRRFGPGPLKNTSKIGSTEGEGDGE